MANKKNVDIVHPSIFFFNFLSKITPLVNPQITPLNGQGCVDLWGACIYFATPMMHSALVNSTENVSYVGTTCISVSHGKNCIMNRAALANKCTYIRQEVKYSEHSYL